MADIVNGGGGEDRRVVRHRWKHHRKSVPPTTPNRWPDAADGSAGRAVGRLHHRNGTAPVARSQHHVLHAGAPPATMCYTTNEVLVIIAVTCFLNFAFILLVMTCVHCFTEPSHHKKEMYLRQTLENQRDHWQLFRKMKNEKSYETACDDEE